MCRVDVSELGCGHLALACGLVWCTLGDTKNNTRATKRLTQTQL